MTNAAEPAKGVASAEGSFKIGDLILRPPIALAQWMVLLDLLFQRVQTRCRPLNWVISLDDYHFARNFVFLSVDVFEISGPPGVTC